MYCNTFIAEDNVNMGGHVEHELQWISLRPVDRLAVSCRRSWSRWHCAQVPAGETADRRRRRVATGRQIAVDGAGLAHCRYSVTDDGRVGRRQAVVGGDRDGKVDDGEVDALSRLGVEPPRTACRPTLQVTRWRRRDVRQSTVDQVAVVGRDLHGLWAWTTALPHRLTPRNW